MCGIAGVFSYRPDGPPAALAEVERMTDAMANRGPDGEGHWASPDGRVVFGHRRLAILDLTESGAQPMHSADGRLTISFNGEIYNYRQLRRDLESRGFRFRSTSDTEVILSLWILYGPELVHKLRGMFGIAIWDSTKQQLFLARDAFGIKPLYYANDGQIFRFASQVKALQATGSVRTTPDCAGWAGFWVLGYVPDPHTTIAAIRALPAGHYLTLSRDSDPVITTWFSLRSELLSAQEKSCSLSPVDREELLRDVINDSLAAHQISDVPVGLFLSAGLDSSTLLALATKDSAAHLKAVTLGFREFIETEQDEVPLARKTASLLGVDHHVRTITKDDFRGHLSRVMAAMDQPSIDGLNTYFVALAASEAGLKVALSGLGADELLGGYPSFLQVPKAARHLRPFAKLPHLNRRFRRMLAPFLRSGLSPKTAGILEYGSTLEGAYFLRRGLFMPWELPGLVGSLDAKEGWEALNLLDRLRQDIQGLTSDHARVMALETGWYMGGQLLRDADWASMAHGVELRVPFVDIDLFRTLAPLQAGPMPYLKADLAKLGSSHLLDALLRRPKTGFTTPVRAWARELLGSQREDRGLRGWARVVSNPRRHGPASESGNRRVLFLATDAYGGVGGIARFNRDFAEAVCQHDDVGEVVLVPRVMPHAPEPTPPKLTLAFESSMGRIHYLLSFIRRLRNLPAVDLIICGHINLLPLAHLARTLTGAPQLLITHGIDAWEPPKGRPWAAHLARKPDHLIAVSSLTLDRFRKWTGLPSEVGIVFPNTFTPHSFAPGPKPDYLLKRYGLEGKTILLTVGRMVALERYKGFDEVLELLPRLKIHHPNIAYLAVGDGSDRPRLQQKSLELGLGKDVVFPGFISEDEKADHYRLADAYVMPSRGEGFGIVFLEALACGIPVLGSNLDGGRDALLNGRLGQLVNPDHPEDTLAGILDLLAQKHVPQSSALKIFAFPAFTKRTHKLLNSIWESDHSTQSACHRPPS